MQLTKQHREGLLHSLSEAKEKLELAQSFLNKSDGNNVAYAEIECFLAGEKIKLIEKSLIDNEIDF